MKKLVLSILFPALVLFPLLGQTSGGDRHRGFAPGQQVVFAPDFSRCPSGSLPAVFDKVEGTGECVKFAGRTWIAPAGERFRVYKRVNLASGDFTVEFNLMINQRKVGPGQPRFWFELYKSNGRFTVKLPITLEVAGISGGFCGVFLTGLGKVATLRNCSGKTLHFALRARNRRLMLFLNGRMLASVPFKLDPGEFVSGLEFTLNDFRFNEKYGILLSGIRVARAFSGGEERGIRVERTPRGVKFMIPGELLFGRRGFFLRPGAARALRPVVDALRKHPEKQAFIVVYAGGENPGADLCRTLRKAQSVADYLRYGQGIKADRIKIELRMRFHPDQRSGGPEEELLEIKVY